MRPSKKGFQLAAWAASLVIVLAGCGAESKEAASVSETVGGYHESSASWKPASLIEWPEYSDEELNEWREKYLADQAASLEIANPPVEDLMRWTLSASDANTAEAECLTENGFPAEVSATGEGIEFPTSINAEQEPAFNLASYVCAARYTPMPSVVSNWTPEQLGMLYDYWTQAYIPCIESRGYEAPPNKPSREVYIDTFFSENTERWWAYDNLPAFDPENSKLVELERSCPRMPPEEYFYGH